MNFTRINTVECITRYWKSVLVFLFLGFLIFLIHFQLVQERITISRKIYLGIQDEIPNQPDVTDYSSLLKSAGEKFGDPQKKIMLQKINKQLVATIQSTESSFQVDSQALMEATEMFYRVIKTNYDNFTLSAKNLESKYIKINNLIITNSAFLTKTISPYEASLRLDSIQHISELARDTLKLSDLLEKRAVFQPVISKVEVNASVDWKQLIKLFFGYETTSLILCFLYIRYKNK